MRNNISPEQLLVRRFLLLINTFTLAVLFMRSIIGRVARVLNYDVLMSALSEEGT